MFPFPGNREVALQGPPLFYERIVLEDNWREYSLCRGVSSDMFIKGEGRRGTLDLFIKNYCNNCPVDRECLSEALPVDLEISVRGGSNPYDYDPVRRTYRDPSIDWSPKSPPKTPGTGRGMIARRICNNNLHGIFSSDDLLASGGCRACRMQGIKPAPAPTAMNAECRKGHRIEGDNALKEGNYFRCKICKYAANAEIRMRRRARIRG